MFSLPMGCGFTPAISQFETAQPMATRDASSMETSMNSPSPLRSRRNSAAAIAKAAEMPPIVSATGYPTRSGADCASPVTLITPQRPWMIWS